jgi:hypothetical protein
MRGFHSDEDSCCGLCHCDSMWYSLLPPYAILKASCGGWVGHVAYVEEKMNRYRVLVRKL